MRGKTISGKGISNANFLSRTMPHCVQRTSRRYECGKSQRKSGWRDQRYTETSDSGDFVGHFKDFDFTIKVW